MESKAVQREIDSLQKKFGDRKARAIPRNYPHYSRNSWRNYFGRAIL